ncbi:MAG: class I SAM-dependent methyltransferase [Eubacteriales bacterium]|nr:class I SAM-dependent methyltransferase [Clostridiales bacterium]MDY5836420.1 class I SAM-dependent methyltransferase [Eubacteriales bacterium]
MSENLTRPPKLMPRLQHIKDLISPCGRLWDIGCDHGYLGVHMYLTGACQEAILTDLRAKPLAEAQKLACAYGLGPDQVTLLLGDGFAGQEAQAGDTIVIAGMGAYEIRSILQSLDLSQDYTICLQPTWNREVLRRYLAGQAMIIEESLVQDRGRTYSIFYLRRGGEKRDLSLAEAAIGEAWMADSPIYKDYLQKDPGLLYAWLAYLARVYGKRRRKDPAYAPVYQEILDLLPPRIL